MSVKNFFIAVPDSYLDEIRDIFNKYANSFRNNDAVYNRHMELKQFHTSKVCDEILDIGSSLGMNRAELNFAEIIAWLHDIGRFEQYHIYGTFSDAESENHSEIGIRVIRQLKILQDLPADRQEVIFQAILNHNIPRVPENRSKEIDFYSRLLRDADKIDIWRVALELNIFHKIRDEKLPDKYDVPEKLFDQFRKNSIITLDQVDTFYDSVLFRVSWIFDINFPRTFQIIRERKILENLLQKLPSSADLENIGKMVQTFLESRLEVVKKEMVNK